MSTAVVSPPRCSNAVYLPAAQVIWIRVQSRISQSWRDRTQHASIDLSPIDFVLKHLKERWPSVRGKGGISSPEENRGLPPPLTDLCLRHRCRPAKSAAPGCPQKTSSRRPGKRHHPLRTLRQRPSRRARQPSPPSTRSRRSRWRRASTRYCKPLSGSLPLKTR
jgi:hypothetical protein